MNGLVIGGLLLTVVVIVIVVVIIVNAEKKKKAAASSSSSTGTSTGTSSTGTSSTGSTSNDVSNKAPFILTCKMVNDKMHNHSTGNLQFINGDNDKIIHTFPAGSFTAANKLADKIFTHTIVGMTTLPSKLKLKMVSSDGIGLEYVKINGVNYGSGQIEPDGLDGGGAATITINKQ